MDASADLAPTEIALLQNGCSHGTTVVTHGICKACVACVAYKQFPGLDREGAASKAGLIIS